MLDTQPAVSVRCPGHAAAPRRRSPHSPEEAEKLTRVPCESIRSRSRCRRSRASPSVVLPVELPPALHRVRQRDSRVARARSEGSEQPLQLPTVDAPAAAETRVCDLQPGLSPGGEVVA